jgi:hypothetical protein
VRRIGKSVSVADGENGRSSVAALIRLEALGEQCLKLVDHVAGSAAPAPARLAPPVRRQPCPTGWPRTRRRPAASPATNRRGNETVCSAGVRLRGACRVAWLMMLGPDLKTVGRAWSRPRLKAPAPRRRFAETRVPDGAALAHPINERRQAHRPALRVPPRDGKRTQAQVGGYMSGQESPSRADSYSRLEQTPAVPP